MGIPAKALVWVNVYCSEIACLKWGSKQCSCQLSRLDTLSCNWRNEQVVQLRRPILMLRRLALSLGRAASSKDVQHDPKIIVAGDGSTHLAIHAMGYFWTVEVGTFISVGFKSYQTSFQNHSDSSLEAHFWENTGEVWLSLLGISVLNVDLKKIKITSHFVPGI